MVIIVLNRVIIITYMEHIVDDAS